MRNSELDNQIRIKELCTLQDVVLDIQASSNFKIRSSTLLVFYTRLQSFTIFMAIFDVIKRCNIVIWVIINYQNLSLFPIDLSKLELL